MWLQVFVTIFGLLLSESVRAAEVGNSLIVKSAKAKTHLNKKLSFEFGNNVAHIGIATEYRKPQWLAKIGFSVTGNHASIFF